jgi:diguanylate cyclase (GGDEF)-like protein
VSIGTSTYPNDGTTWQQLLDHADKAMYLAKARGRNQVRTAQEL